MRILAKMAVGLLLAIGLAGCGSASGPRCEDACTSGQVRCILDGAGFQACLDVDGDGCFEWAEPEACADGQVCSDGVCGPGPTGLVLSGGLAPLAGAVGTGGLQLFGVVSRDFENRTSSAGGLSLEHGGF